MLERRANVVNLEAYRRRRSAPALPLFCQEPPHPGEALPNVGRLRPARSHWQPTQTQVRHWERMLAFLSRRS